MSNSYIVIAQNPSFSETKQLIKIECPFNKYSLYELNPTDFTLQKIEHDNFRSKNFFNGKDEG